MKKYFVLFIFVICFGIISSAQDLNAGLVAYFPFNGNSNDESAMNIDGVVFGAVLADGLGNQTNGAYSFNGTTSYIECGISNRTITDVVTISFWVRTDSENSMYPVSKYNWTEDAGYFSVFENGVAGTAGRDGSGSFKSTGYGSTYIADGQWHHIISVVDGNVWQIWVDCNLEAAITTGTNSPDIQGTEPLILGKWGYENLYYFDGTLDEVRIYNRTLTPTEMGMLCNSNQFLNQEEVVENIDLKLFPNPCSDLVTIQSLEMQKVEIFNSIGQVVFKKDRLENKSKIEINTSEFENGTYIVVITYDEATKSEQLIIVH